LIKLIDRVKQFQFYYDLIEFVFLLPIISVRPALRDRTTISIKQNNVILNFNSDPYNSQFQIFTGDTLIAFTSVLSINRCNQQLQCKCIFQKVLYCLTFSCNILTSFVSTTTTSFYYQMEKSKKKSYMYFTIRLLEIFD